MRLNRCKKPIKDQKIRRDVEPFPWFLTRKAGDGKPYLLFS